MGRARTKRQTRIPLARHGRMRPIKSTMYVYRLPGQVGREAFDACVQIGKRHVVCAAGKNPRAALGAALKKLGTEVVQRRGAFHGLSRDVR